MVWTRPTSCWSIRKDVRQTSTSWALFRNRRFFRDKLNRPLLSASNLPDVRSKFHSMPSNSQRPTRFNSERWSPRACMLVNQCSAWPATTMDVSWNNTRTVDVVVVHFPLPIGTRPPCRPPHRPTRITVMPVSTKSWCLCKASRSWTRWSVNAVHRNSANRSIVCKTSWSRWKERWTTINWLDCNKIHRLVVA